MKNDPPAPTVITFASRKGGVGKTTLALALSSRLAEKHRVLLIDMDQDGDATFGIGGDLQQPGAAALITGGEPVFQKRGDSLDLLCGNQDLEDPTIDRAEPEALADAIKQLPYDYVVIDSPANAHQLQKLCVVAASSVLIPMNAHPFAIMRGRALIGELEKRRASGRQGAEKWAIVANPLDTRRKLDREFVDQIEAGTDFGAPVYVIRQNTVFSQATTAQQPCSSFPGATSAMPEIDQIIKWLRS